MMSNVETLLELVAHRPHVPVYVLIPGHEIKIKMDYRQLVVSFAALRNNLRNTVVFEIAGEAPDQLEVNVLAVYDDKKGYWDGYQFTEWPKKNT